MAAYKQRGGMVQKPSPPLVLQPVLEVPGIGTLAIAPTCWAAALSSWLIAARAEERSIADLVKTFAPYLSDGGSLQLNHFKDVAESYLVRMDFEAVRGSELTWDYLYDKLTYSYVYTMLIGSQMSHAVVIYAITLDSRGTRDVHLMDPKDGMIQGVLSMFQKRSSTFVVGWAKEGTRFMLS